MMRRPARSDRLVIATTCGRRSSSYVSSSSRGAPARSTALTFHDKLVTSRIPELRPWPAIGGIRWAASPHNMTRPTRHRCACSAWNVYDVAQYLCGIRVGMLGDHLRCGARLQDIVRIFMGHYLAFPTVIAVGESTGHPWSRRIHRESEVGTCAIGSGSFASTITHGSVKVDPSSSTPTASRTVLLAPSQPRTSRARARLTAPWASRSSSDPFCILDQPGQLVIHPDINPLIARQSGPKVPVQRRLIDGRQPRVCLRSFTGQSRGKSPAGPGGPLGARSADHVAHRLLVDARLLQTSQRFAIENSHAGLP